MSNNGPINPGNGQVNIPFPAAPATPSTPSAPSGGWHIFQTVYPNGYIYIDGYGAAGGGGAGAAPAVAEEKKINRDGCKCKKCKEYYPYAQANQDDGTLICYVCRKGL